MAYGEAKTVREDQLEEALLRIKQWAEAYPVEVFRPVSDDHLKIAATVLESAGISLAAIHGEWARHILDGIAKICEEGLKDG